MSSIWTLVTILKDCRCSKMPPSSHGRFTYPLLRKYSIGVILMPLEQAFDFPTMVSNKSTVFAAVSTRRLLACNYSIKLALILSTSRVYTMDILFKGIVKLCFFGLCFFNDDVSTPEIVQRPLKNVNVTDHFINKSLCCHTFSALRPLSGTSKQS